MSDESLITALAGEVHQSTYQVIASTYNRNIAQPGAFQRTVTGSKIIQSAFHGGMSDILSTQRMFKHFKLIFSAAALALLAVGISHQSLRALSLVYVYEQDQEENVQRSSSSRLRRSVDKALEKKLVVCTRLR